jgi:hypothetical protein
MDYESDTVLPVGENFYRIWREPILGYWTAVQMDPVTMEVAEMIVLNADSYEEAMEWVTAHSKEC